MDEELGDSQEKQENYCAPLISARIVNFASPLALKNFKANCYGKAIFILNEILLFFCNMIIN